MHEQRVGTSIDIIVSIIISGIIVVVAVAPRVVCESGGVCSLQRCEASLQPRRVEHVPLVEDGSGCAISADVAEGHRDHPSAGADVRILLQEVPEVLLLRLVERHPNGRRQEVAMPRPPLRRWARRRQGREEAKVVVVVGAAAAAVAVAVAVAVTARWGKLVLARLLVLPLLELLVLLGLLVLLELLVPLGLLVLSLLELLVLQGLLGLLELLELLVQLELLVRLELLVLLGLLGLRGLRGQRGQRGQQALAVLAAGDPGKALEGLASGVVHVDPLQQR